MTIYRDTKTGRLGKMYKVSPPKVLGRWVEFHSMYGPKYTHRVTQLDVNSNRFVQVAIR